VVPRNIGVRFCLLLFVGCLSAADPGADRSSRHFVTHVDLHEKMHHCGPPGSWMSTKGWASDASTGDGYRHCLVVIHCEFSRWMLQGAIPGAVASS
jgi:hypothetical protein